MHVHPDIESRVEEVFLEACCDFESVFAAVAEEDFWALCRGLRGGSLEGGWGKNFLGGGVGEWGALCGGRGRGRGGGGSGSGIEARFAGCAFPLGGLFLPENAF